MTDWFEKRTANAQFLTDALKPFTTENGVVRLPELVCEPVCKSQNCVCQKTLGCRHARYKFYAYVRPENLASGWDRDRIIEAINAEGVPCYRGSCSEVYLEKAFDNTGWRPEARLPNAKELGETSVMFLIHPTLTDNEIIKTSLIIKKVFERAQK
jgi:dTDP-4-amino-4,6-dideoxygalactose transaminase